MQQKLWQISLVNIVELQISSWSDEVDQVYRDKNADDDRYCSVRQNQEKQAMDTENSGCTEKFVVIFDNRTGNDVKKLFEGPENISFGLKNLSITFVYRKNSVSC